MNRSLKTKLLLAPHAGVDRGATGWLHRFGSIPLGHPHRQRSRGDCHAHHR